MVLRELGSIHFQKGQPEDAIHALSRINGAVPEEIRDDIEFLRANIYMATGQPGEAVEDHRAKGLEHPGFAR